MKSIFVFVLPAIIFIVFTACSRQDNTPAHPTPSARIDVNDFYGADANGNLLYVNLSDSQWQSKTFSVEEINLFATLDTADLTGTSTPDSVNQYSKKALRYQFLCYAFPNPFSTSFIISPYFNEDFAGKIVFKYVIADSLLHTVAKGAALLQANSANHISRTSVMLQPDIPAGHFRLYYTLSSKPNEHFYQSWGNIQKED